MRGRDDLKVQAARLRLEGADQPIYCVGMKTGVQLIDDQQAARVVIAQFSLEAIERGKRSANTGQTILSQRNG